MDIFYIIVPSIAISLLILILAFIGIKLARNNGGKLGPTAVTFPPQYSTCPDKWTISAGGNCTIPASNTINGNSDIIRSKKSAPPGAKNNGTEISFGTAGMCDLYTWSNQNSVVWDGVSNYNGCY
jgi:hypothetical protein